MSTEADDREKLHGFVEGLKLIQAREPATPFDIHNDQLYIGNPEQYTPEERAQLEAWGWSEDEEAWMYFT